MARKKYRLLIINPGSTSTKIAVFENEKPLFEKNIQHSTIMLEQYSNIWEQYPFRKEVILQELEKLNFDTAALSAVVGRGGLLKPILSGTYMVNQNMIDDARLALRGEHASNLGCVLAYGIAWDLGIEAYIVDPVSVDEFEPMARISGLPEIERESLLHALNIKAVARTAAKDMRKKLEDLNLIVAHMGGGITVAALRKGQMINSNHGIEEGPFTPERSGSLPTGKLAKLCFSGKYTLKEIQEKLAGRGGLTAYLGINNAAHLEELIREGNSRAKLIYEAMAYQIAGEISSRASNLKGKVDAVILTGGLAHSKMLTDWIKERVSFIAKVKLYPGENEMEALALGGLRVLKGEESAKVYGVKKLKIGSFYWEQLSEYDIGIEELEKVLRDSGFKFRQSDEDIEIIYRNAEKKVENLRQICGDFIDMGVNLIISIGSPAVSGVKRYLKGLDIPVVCIAVFDPVIMGLVNDYRNPGGNITGTCYRVSIKDQIKKGLAKIVPHLRKAGIIYKTGELHSEIQHDEAKETAKELGFKLLGYDLQSEEQFNEALDFFLENKVDALILPADTTFAEAKRSSIKKIAHKIPTLCFLKSTVAKGGLVSYCADWRAVCREGARQAVRILSGEHPDDIPIALPREHLLVINLQTAKELSIEIPEKIIKEAQEIIR